MKSSWFRRFWTSLLGIRILEERRVAQWRVLITNTDAGPRERMFVVLLKDLSREQTYPILLTHSETHAKEVEAQVEADLAALNPEEIVAKYVHTPVP